MSWAAGAHRAQLVGHACRSNDIQLVARDSIQTLGQLFAAAGLGHAQCIPAGLCATAVSAGSWCLGEMGRATSVLQRTPVPRPYMTVGLVALCSLVPGTLDLTSWKAYKQRLGEAAGKRGRAAGVAGAWPSSHSARPWAAAASLGVSLHSHLQVFNTRGCASRSALCSPGPPPRRSGSGGASRRRWLGLHAGLEGQVSRTVVARSQDHR